MSVGEGDAVSIVNAEVTNALSRMYEQHKKLIALPTSSNYEPLSISLSQMIKTIKSSLTHTHTHTHRHTHSFLTIISAYIPSKKKTESQGDKHLVRSWRCEDVILVQRHLTTAHTHTHTHTARERERDDDVEVRGQGA